MFPVSLSAKGLRPSLCSGGQQSTVLPGAQLFAGSAALAGVETTAALTRTPSPTLVRPRRTELLEETDLEEPDPAVDDQLTTLEEDLAHE
jgi:hypothetical protein